jgi:hypothetical protein
METLPPEILELLLDMVDEGVNVSLVCRTWALANRKRCHRRHSMAQLLVARNASLLRWYSMKPKVRLRQRDRLLLACVRQPTAAKLNRAVLDTSYYHWMPVAHSLLRASEFMAFDRLLQCPRVIRESHPRDISQIFQLRNAAAAAVAAAEKERGQGAVDANAIVKKTNGNNRDYTRHL